MPNLINRETNKVEDLSPEEAGQALLSGKYALKAGERVNLQDEIGEIVSVDPSEVGKAIMGHGYTFPAQEAVDNAELDQKYKGGLENNLKAAAISALRTASFGASDYALKDGVFSQEELRELPARNPLGNFSGTVAGFAVPGGLTSGAAKIGKGVAAAARPLVGTAATAGLAKRALSGATLKGIEGAVEGSFYGLGQSVSESALGDPEVNGQKVAHNVLENMLLGGAGNVLFAPLSAASKKVLSPQMKEAAARDAIKTGTAIARESEPIAQRTIADMAAEAAGMPTPLGDLALPSQKALLDADQVLTDLKFPTMAWQVEGLSNKAARDRVGAVLESQSQLGQDLNLIQAHQKQESVQKLKETVQNIAPGKQLGVDRLSTGQELQDFVETTRKAKREQLAPLFEQIDSVGSTAIYEPQVIIDHVERAIPTASKYLNVTPNGVVLQKYSAAMPFAKETYNALKEVVEFANRPNGTLGELRNVRNSIGDRLVFGAPDRVYSQIVPLRKELMDFMESEIQKQIPNLEVRNAFKEYAINEQNYDAAKKIFGKNAAPEDIVKNIFRNSNTVADAKAILGNEKFNEITANWLNGEIGRVSDPTKNGFSSNKFSTFLRDKAPELQVALADNPEAVKRIQALTTRMQILPDAPSVNPSGTAKTAGLLERIKNLGSMLDINFVKTGGELIGKAVDKYGKKTQEAADRLLLDQLQSGASYQEAAKIADDTLYHYQVLKQVEEAAAKTTRQIVRGVDSLFSTAVKSRPAVVETYLLNRNLREQGRDSRNTRSESFNHRTNNISTIATNPEQLMSRLTAATSQMSPYAPGVSAGIQNTAARAVGFLQSKLPKTPPRQPLSPEWKPNQTEIAAFNRYYNAVKNPLSVLDEMKSGTLSLQAVEAVSSVYPDLYSEMKQEMVEKLTKQKKPVKYQTRLMLSLFMGQDMDGSTSPQAIMSNQAAIMGPSQQQDNQPVKTTQGGLENIDSADRMLTPMQRTAGRSA
jgi:hypothetical protein